MKRAFVGGYWGPRAEPLDACVARSMAYLHDLTESHKLLATWYRRASSPAAALAAPIPLTPESIESLLLEGRNRRDSDGSVIGDLGYSFGAWNGANPTDDATIDILCGVTAERVPNSVQLNLPEHGGGAEDLYDHDGSLRLVESLARRWDPDWASFTSKELRRAQRAREQGRIVVGQHTYIAARRGTPADLPEQFTTTRVDDSGTIISIVGVEATADLIGALVASLDPQMLRK